MIATASNSAARSAIFASIRDSLAASAPFDEIRREHQGQPFTSGVSAASAVSDRLGILDVFKGSIELVGAKCAFVENEDEAAEHLRVIVAELAAERVVASDSGLVSRLTDSAGIDALENASMGELFSSDVGITSAQWAIAETGTLVLESSAERHRLVSLVPPVHVCVLAASSIRRTMAEILELLNTDADRAVTFITGASRTSDIELTLAIGVHGPGELHVIVIRDQ